MELWTEIIPLVTYFWIVGVASGFFAGYTVKDFRIEKYEDLVAQERAEKQRIIDEANDFYRRWLNGQRETGV